MISLSTNHSSGGRPARPGSASVSTLGQVSFFAFAGVFSQTLSKIRQVKNCTPEYLFGSLSYFVLYAMIPLWISFRFAVDAVTFA